MRLSSFLSSHTKQQATILVISLIIINVVIWALAFFVFKGQPELIGMALIAWSFGLRHAVDADHIAAIDNTTRKIMSTGKTPIAVGTYFSLGHSTIVVLAAAAIALTADRIQNHMPHIAEIGGHIGSLVSIAFLLIMAWINAQVFLSTHHRFKRLKNAKNIAFDDEESPIVGGLFFRLFHRLFQFITKSWHMYFIGFLFGLGFDTATEIGLLAISATNASHGMNIWLIMIFPALFTASMSLIDTLDNFLMIGAYGWAFEQPARKLYYNMTITAVSVLIAITIGGIELLNFISDYYQLTGRFWDSLNSLSDHWSWIGGGLVLLFIGCWIFSVVNYKRKGYDKLSSVTA